MKKNNPCPYEETIPTGLENEIIDPVLAKHMDNCPQCQEAHAFKTLMKDFKQKTMTNYVPSLPGAFEIWERARLSRKTDKELIKKAMRPLLVPQILSFILAIFGVYMFIIPHIDIIEEFFLKKTKTLYFFKSFVSLVPKLFKSLDYIMIPMALILICMVIFFLFALIKPKIRLGEP